MNVTIRPLQTGDANTSVKWRNIPELWVYTKFKATRQITIQDEQEWIEKVIKDPVGARFAILADGVYVGNIYLTNIADGTAEYHIFIGEQSYWGKGIARKASVQIINYGKDMLKLKYIKLLVNKENTSAYNLYSRLGFVEVRSNDHDFLEMILNLHEWSGDSDDTIR